MQFLTLNQAAKAATKSKSAVLEAIRSGRLSAIRNDLNQWQIDPAELFRVYPVERPETEQQNNKQNTDQPQQNALLMEKIGHLEKQLQTAEKDRDQWQQQAERITMLLTHQQQLALPNPEPPQKKRGVLQRLFGKRR